MKFSSSRKAFQVRLQVASCWWNWSVGLLSFIRPSYSKNQQLVFVILNVTSDLQFYCQIKRKNISVEMKFFIKLATIIISNLVVIVISPNNNSWELSVWEYSLRGWSSFLWKCRLDKSNNNASFQLKHCEHPETKTVWVAGFTYWMWIHIHILKGNGS